MKYVGIDLHKQIIVLCVVTVVGNQRQIVARKRLNCRDTAALDEFFAGLGEFQLAVEATAVIFMPLAPSNSTLMSKSRQFQSFLDDRR